MTLFPSGRSRVRRMAKAILLLEKLRWRQENGRRNICINVYNDKDQEGQ